MWTEAHIKKLAADGKIRGYTDLSPPKKVKGKRPKIPEQTPTGLLHIKNTLILAGIPFVTEYRFALPRKFRFDIALPDLMIAIEYEGLMSAKSRHTTAGGYSNDATKYNLAQSLGWRVYRYTTLNYKEFNISILKS